MVPVCLFLLLLDTPALIRQIAASGQVAEIAAPPAERLSPPDRVAPGAPPLVSFRLYEGNQLHRFGNLDLVMDDAGH
ncbi:MAG TPA: hypothetical protein VFA33_12185 [Bryobacteraceae bacterium]|nr:hypothetical protein [Bryobacteraceae bacterium]